MNNLMNENLMQTDFYVSRIKDLLSERAEKNSGYSLRALARDVGIDASYLSQVLQNKKRITPKAAFKFANHLKLEGQVKLDFIVPSLVE